MGTTDKDGNKKEVTITVLSDEDVTDKVTKEIFDLMVTTSEDFLPMLAGDYDSIVLQHELLMLNDKFIIVRDYDSKMVGLLGYIQKYEHVPTCPDKDTDNIDLIIVTSELRDRGVGRALHKTFEEMDDAPDVATLRTWSTNARQLALLDSIGYKPFRIVKDDRDPEIDTVFLYKKLR